MFELVVATKNKGKLREIKELLAGLPFTITSLEDYPDAPEIVEDGKSFAENALIKAWVIAQYTEKLTMGEDSGIEVKALNNQPGIYSARFSDPNATDRKNNLKMLRLLKHVPLKERQACYRCFISVVDGERMVAAVNGQCRGLIAVNPKGKNGFGYDPLFLIPRYHKTFGELDPKIKAKISHRAHALKKLKKFLGEWYLNRS
ncbi:MAG: RdgB/HAM1 family non-canonical purine NTP pyrophosphatase [Candidatus Omnitrophica bacterium]|nr:RdgB/HAM1 family non-canonical purine NTP pyrophosphatase [Candidatus Omnitrophota bacterium]